MDEILDSKLYYKDDPARYMALAYVKAFVVEHFVDFSMCDGEKRQSSWLHLLGHKEDYIVELKAKLRTEEVRYV